MLFQHSIYYLFLVALYSRWVILNIGRSALLLHHFQLLQPWSTIFITLLKFIFRLNLRFNISFTFKILKTNLTETKQKFINCLKNTEI